jgi:hypothetical protein
VTRELQRPVSYYHLWCGDRYHGADWEGPAREWFTALADAWFDGDVRVGLAGGMSERVTAMRWLRENCPSSQVAVQADEGFEMVTLAELHRFAKEAEPSTPVLYGHGKGSFQGGPFADAWRRAMTRRVVSDWRHCVNSLNTVDMAGCHWLTHERYPRQITEGLPMFGGNFWWANAGYLAKLPPIDPHGANRYAAESWAGLGRPRVECLIDGWPDYSREAP